MPKLSIVTPCYNEAGGIAECHAVVRRVMETELSDFDYEHIFIDNCSHDGTVEILRKIAAGDSRVRVILNARNFGPARSPFHAFLQASGDAVVPVLADLQTPPALIPQMVACWRAGAKSVLAIKTSVKMGLLRSVGRAAFYRLVQLMSRKEQIPEFEGYGLYDRCVVDAMRGLNEPEPYFRGLVLEIGFERAFVSYEQPARKHGTSSYTLYSLADYALLGLSISSRVPLRLMTILGFFSSVLSLIAALVYLVIKLVFWYSLPVGVAPIVISVFFLAALQLFALGVLGEYIGLLLNYSRGFPLVIEKERINFPQARGEPERSV